MLLLNQYYKYRHIRPDTNQIFYIGKGTNRRNQYRYERAYIKKRRSKFLEK